jgi:hypothetical protein
VKDGHLRTAIWFVGVFFLAAWGVFGWLRFPPQERFVFPETPFEGTSGLDPAQWRFLQQVREILPEGESFTVVAANESEEMQVFMLACGVLDSEGAIPTTYYNVHNEYARQARYILSYRCAVVPEDAVVVARLEDGCVCEREE